MLFKYKSLCSNTVSFNQFVGTIPCHQEKKYHQNKHHLIQHDSCVWSLPEGMKSYQDVNDDEMSRHFCHLKINVQNQHLTTKSFLYTLEHPHYIKGLNCIADFTMLIATTANSSIQKYTYNCTASLLHLSAFFGHQVRIKKNGWRTVELKPRF